MLKYIAMGDKVLITFSGCKVNQFEKALLLELFQKEGFFITDNLSEADYIVFNTCAVTNKAESGCRQLIRKFNRLNPNSKIVITGCYAEKERDKLLSLPGVYKVFSNDEKLSIPARLLDKKINNINPLNFEYKRIFKDRSRAFLKVQDGCDSYCSYCIVPFLRGKPVSMPLQLVLKNLHNLKDENEVVLTGIHLGKWGKDIKMSFEDLMLAISKEKFPFRIRLSSLEVNEITNNLLEILKDMDNFCHHFHIPIQSGNDKILKLMKRNYDISFFKNKINELRRFFPNACIGTDIIVGFPGEDDGAFFETYSFLEDLPIDYMHIFTYSPRKGTQSYNYKNIVDKEIVLSRYKKLKELDYIKRKIFFEKFLNKDIWCIPDKKIDENRYRVLSREYIKVFINNKVPDKEFKAKLINIKTFEAVLVN